MFLLEGFVQVVQVHADDQEQQVTGSLQFGKGELFFDQVVFDAPDIFHDVRPSQQLVQAGVAEFFGKTSEGVHGFTVLEKKTHAFVEVGLTEIVAVVSLGSGIELLFIESKRGLSSCLLKDACRQGARGLGFRVLQPVLQVAQGGVHSKIFNQIGSIFAKNPDQSHPVFLVVDPVVPLVSSTAADALGFFRMRRRNLFFVRFQT